MDDQELLERVERYASVNPGFDIAFVESLREYYEDRGELTMGQNQALQNIIEKFRIKNDT